MTSVRNVSCGYEMTDRPGHIDGIAPRLFHILRGIRQLFSLKKQHDRLVK